MHSAEGLRAVIFSRKSNPKYTDNVKVEQMITVVILDEMLMRWASSKDKKQIDKRKAQEDGRMNVSNFCLFFNRRGVFWQLWDVEEKPTVSLLHVLWTLGYSINVVSILILEGSVFINT